LIQSQVCLAGAPLFEGRWIPDAGEIIPSSCDFLKIEGFGRPLIPGFNPAGETKMRKLNLLFFAVVGVLLTAMPVLAQAPVAEQAADSNAGLKAIAAGVGFAIAVVGGALGQSRIGAAACEGAARNPGAAAKIQTMMILGLALIESLVLFALLVVFAKV
jgi:F-type H+-transporting ATPase subunit c